MDFFNTPQVRRTKEQEHSDCIGWVKAVFKSNFRVKALVEAMERHGCSVRIGKNVLCEPCHMDVYGGFDAHRAQAVVCENTVKTREKVEDVLVHELVHAYDHCRAKVNWTYLPHIACSEIRAAALSGECRMTIDKFFQTSLGLKGWKLHMGGVDCARRHAIRSLQVVSAKSSMKEIEEAVDQVFTNCYLDSDPFDAIPPLHRSNYG